MQIEDVVDESPAADNTAEEIKEITTENKWGAPIENS
jgi:hypothetical protein